MIKLHKTQFILLVLLNIVLVIACIIMILYISDTSNQSKDQIIAIKSQVESFENSSTGKHIPTLVGKLYKTLESGNAVIASANKLIFTLSKFVIILSTFQLFIFMYAFYKNKRK